MTIHVIGTGDGECIAAWSLEHPPPVFDGFAVEGITARREGAIEAVEELERRTVVLAVWIVENDPRECAECGGAADAVELTGGYPLCRACSTFETRRRYG